MSSWLPTLYTLENELLTLWNEESQPNCVIGCHRLLRREAIMAGGSSGGVLIAVERMNEEIPQGAVCVVLFPERGERYLDTIYSEAWVREHFGGVPHLWRYLVETRACMTITY